MSLELPTRPESLSDVVYETIRDAIVHRTIPPGARVTETGLAKQLDVSKTPVREALLKLREIGLIEPHGACGGRGVAPGQQVVPGERAQHQQVRGARLVQPGE